MCGRRFRDCWSRCATADGPARTDIVAGMAEEGKHGEVRTDDEFRDDFVGRFSAYWQSQGRPKAEGRIVGYLLVADRDAVGAEEIAGGAGVSRGSVSEAVRRLRELGFVTLVDAPDGRSKLVSMDEDVWGGFLRNERSYLRQQRDLAASALDRLPGLGPTSRNRLRNMYDYMTWLDGYHDTLLAHWEEYKASRRACRGDSPEASRGDSPEGETVRRRTPQ